MNLTAELHTLAINLRKQHQTTDLFILEQAVSAGARLVLSEAILKVRAATEELIKTRWNANRPQ
jgi:predicted nucleic acid-binding protein